MAVVAVTLMSTTAMCLRSRMSLRRGSLWVRLWRRAVLRTRGFHVLLRLRTVLDPRLRLRLLHWPILHSWLRLGLRRRPIFNARLRLRL